jgi:serine/threonine-protein kinase RsbW
MINGNTVRLDLHSSLEMLDFVQMVSDHIGRMAGLDDDAIHWVSVAVRESVINAIKHGNACDAQKRVHVEFTALDDGRRAGIAVCVRDEGCGFDPAQIADPLAPENILKTGGRGIFLMRTFMDEMTFQRGAEGGMEVRMIKRADQPGIA